MFNEGLPAFITNTKCSLITFSCIDTKTGSNLQQHSRVARKASPEKVNVSQVTGSEVQLIQSITMSRVISHFNTVDNNFENTNLFYNMKIP